MSDRDEEPSTAPLRLRLTVLACVALVTAAAIVGTVSRAIAGG